jgi:hypothetical protein
MAPAQRSVCLTSLFSSKYLQQEKESLKESEGADVPREDYSQIELYADGPLSILTVKQLQGLALTLAIAM